MERGWKARARCLAVVLSCVVAGCGGGGGAGLGLAEKPSEPTDLTISDTGNGRMAQIDDLNGAGWTSLASDGPGAMQLKSPGGMAMDDQGRIFIADTGNHRIVRMNSFLGDGWTSVGTFGGDPGQFKSPSDIVIWKGYLWITSRDTSKIIRMNLDLNPSSWKIMLLNVSQPSGLAADGLRLYIADTGNHRIMSVSDVNLGGFKLYGTQGSGVGQFQSPRDIAVDADGRLYIADTGNHRIVRMDNLTGAGFTSFGSQGSGVGQFNSPSSVAVDIVKRIFVADTGNHRVVRLTEMGPANWRTFGVEGSGNNQLRSPRSVFVR